MPAPAYSITPLLAHGSQLRVGRGDTPTWTSSTGLLPVMFPDQSPADIDITNMGSGGLAEEFMPGLLPAVDFSQEMIYDAGSDWDAALTELDERAEDGSKELHLLEITVGTGADAVQGTWVAYLKQYKPSGELKGFVKMTAIWKIMQRIATVVEAPEEGE